MIHLQDQISDLIKTNFSIHFYERNDKFLEQMGEIIDIKLSKKINESKIEMIQRINKLDKQSRGLIRDLELKIDR